MSESYTSIRREGNLIAIETWVSDAGYKGVANTSLLGAGRGDPAV